VTRLEAIKASPLGYAKRGNYMATTHQLFQEKEPGVLSHALWQPGMSQFTDWEPVMPEVASVEEVIKPAEPTPAPAPSIGREYKGRRR
jgi:hypothetical protein